MVVQRHRAVRILVLLSLLLGSLNGMALPGLGVNAVATPYTSAQPTHSPGKSEFAGPEANASRVSRVAEFYGKLPMSFEPNEGQFDSRVKFASRGHGYALFLTANEAVISLTRPVENDSSSDSGGQPNAALTQPVDEPKATERSQSLSQSLVRPGPPQTRSVLRMKLVNARRSLRAEPMDELPGKSNYFIGNDPAKWRTNVSNYAKVRCRSVYRGIDLVYYGDQRTLEYDFNVAPGADPRAIRLRFDGAERVRIDSTGDLLLSAAGGEIRQHKPVVYQEVDGTRKEIRARYVVKSKNQVGFEVGRYDSRKALVIDPVLSYSTYLGGTVFDDGRSIALDTGGNAYVTGLTFSPDFPTMNPIQPSPNGAGEGYVTKLNKEGSELIYSTYLGGSLRDEGNGIAVDPGGNAYITGRTESTNFPIANAFQSSHTGTSSDAFVTKLSPAGNALTYSTYLGGTSQDFGRGIAADAAGSAFVTGQTASPNFPTQNPLQPISSGGGFLTKFSPSGLALEYSTYIGGIGIGVALDSSGNAYVTGGTFRLDMPLVNPVQSQLKGQTVFKSIDGAANWTEINNGLTALSNVRTLAIDPTVPTTVYIGLGGPGVFKSTNGGASWSATNNTSFTLGVNQLVIDPATPSTLYCRGGNDISKSTDGGGSWNSVIFGSFGALAIDPITTQNVYAAQGQGVSRSTNGGSTWQATLVSGGGHLATTLRGLAVDPITPSTIFVVDGSSQLFKSTNSGSTWSFITQDFSPSNGILIDPANHTTLYGWNGSFFAGATKSTDAGQTWASISSGLPGTLLRTMTIDPITTSTLFAGTLDGVYTSTNGGTTWNHNQNRLTNAAVNAIAIDPLTTSTLYVGTDLTGDGFVAKLNSTGSVLLYSTYLGGDVSDSAGSIAVDAAGNAYVTGSTASLNFPVANALFPFSGAPFDAFVTKLNTAAPEIIYSTYLGGSSFDVGRGIAVDQSGNAYVTGQTSSMNFPQVSSVLPFGDGQLGEGFLTKLSASGTTLLFSTFLGGADSSNALAINSSGDAYLAGQVSSPNFTTTPGAFQTSLADPGGDAFVMKIGSSPSAVKLSSFKATGYDEGVYLKWETGFEASNLGFNIYREVAGKRGLVNPDLIAGSALRAGANTRLQAGQSYSWWDKGIADCGSRIAECPDAQYWLEEIDLNGTRTTHGPFSVHRVGGEPSRESRAGLLSSLGRGGPRMGQMPLVYPTVHSKSTEAKQSAMTLSSAGRKTFGLGPSPALKMTIREEGWYRVTRQDLVAAGFDVKSDPRRLRLYVEGEEQAILVRGEQDGRFDGGDRIEFFATGQDNAFTDAHVYWLVSGEGLGMRIGVVKSMSKTGHLRSFAYTVERRDRTIYFSSLRNGDAENFFGAVVASQPVDQTLSIPHLDVQSREAAEVEIALQGVTDLRGEAPDHQVSVRLNGTEIGKLMFDGQTNKAEKYAVKPGLLIEGENVISLESERGSNDVSLLDYIRVTYAHTYASDQDSLRMTAQSGRSQKIAGFTSPSIRVVDISNAAQVAELIGTVEKEADGYAVTVNVAGQGTRTLLALTEDRVKRPAGFTLDRASNLRSGSNEANLLIITRREFFSILEPLKALRESQGLVVELVDIDDIYDEFSYGEKTPQAVKDFITYAAGNWNGKPSVVLMAGDASFDARNYLGFGDNDIVPTRLVDTSLMETASDDWFVDFKDDGRPEVAVGRLPFRTADEAVTMVSKILSYDRSNGSQEALLVADRNDEFDFESASARAGELMAATLKVNRIDRGRVDGANAKTQLMEALGRGQKVVNYIGHGSANKWNGELLTNEEARGLKNGERLPMFVMMTCLNGYFQDAAGESLAESLMKSEGGGAVAVWASSGVTAPGGQMVINRELYRMLFIKSKNMTLGEAVMRAKRVGSDPDIRRTWILLGDPTMRLK